MNEKLFEEKKQLRREVLEKRRAMSQSEVAEKSEVICDTVLKLSELREAEKVCIYMPINNEVDVSLLTDRLRSLGKVLYIPKIGGHNMHFYKYEPDTELAPGSFGILEPVDSEILTADENTLIIMPGAVFTKNRDRIGYGAGYYDRYLKKHPEAKTLAVCYDMQLRDSIPVNANDRRPARLITESAIYE